MPKGGGKSGSGGGGSINGVKGGQTFPKPDMLNNQYEDASMVYNGDTAKLGPGEADPDYHYPLGNFKKTNADPDINPGGVIQRDGLIAEKLAKKDQEAIHAYTGGFVDDGIRFEDLNAEKVNKALYDPVGFKAEHGEEMYKRAKAYANELEADLNKVASYKGEVYRTSLMPPERIAQYKEGGVVQFDNFLSSSASPVSSYKAFADLQEYMTLPQESWATRFVINSKHGKLIRSISEFRREEEVLFNKGSKFKVTKKVWNPDRNTWDIHMEEI